MYCRFDPILVVESIIIFRNPWRFVDRFFASKLVDCRLKWCKKCSFVDKKNCNVNIKNRIFHSKSGCEGIFIVIFT